MPSILIAEDENLVAMAIAESLRRLGHDVAGVTALGEEAVRLARETRPDLILLDIMLSGALDGVQAAARIRAERDVPVVFLTAYSDGRTIARASQTGPYGFIVKPFHDGDLRAAIEVALARHAAERRRDASPWDAWLCRALPDAVVACDASGRVSFMNPAAEALTGFRAADAVGRPAGEVVSLIAVDDGTPRDEPLARAAASGRPERLPDRTDLVTRSGEERPVDGGAAPVQDEAGRPAGAVLLLRDGGDRQRLQGRLQQADRMAALGLLAAGLGHELGNPLAYVAANLEYAIEELEQGAPAEGSLEALKEARQGVERAGRAVRQLRAWARAEVAPPRPADLHDLLETAVGVALTDIRHRARLIKDYGSPPRVAVDEARLTQALTVLLLNAAQAIPAGHPDEHEVRVVTRALDGRAVVELHHTGPGIPAEHLGRVFDPFAAVPGTGPGLSIARAAITADGGTVAATRAPGGATVFTVSLPPAEPAAVAQAAVAQAAAARPTGAGRRGRILVVDDEPLVGSAIQRVLGDEHDLTILGSGRAALDRLAAGERWDLLIVDLAMPEVSGTSVFEALDRLAPELKERVIFLTGDAGQAHSERLADRPLLEKPFDSGELRRVVRSILA